MVADVAGTAAEIASETEAFVWWQGKQRQWGRQTYWQRAVETERQQTMAETEAAVVLEGKGAAVAAAATVGMVSVDNSGNGSGRQRRWKQR